MSAAALLVDRVVSASSADDARHSLKSILSALQSKGDDRVEPSIVWQEEQVLEVFLEIMTSGEFKQMPVERGIPLICQIYSEFLEARDASVILHNPQPGRLIQALLDVVSNEDASTYERVISLQVLQKICKKYPSIAQKQLLEVPNGLHRLADRFRDENEQVRNELLMLAKSIAQWPSCSKIWVFAEVCDSLIQIAINEGGLTNGSVLTVDCVDIIHSLLKHDASISDLVWQSPVFVRNLSMLIDLRRGSEFRFPKKPSQPDDLDDILKSAKEDPKIVVPRLTNSEERLLAKVIDLMGVMLGTERIRNDAWKQHPGIGSLFWELALLTPPLPGAPYLCAVPSARLQQEALECVAEFFASPDTMQRHNGLDRLLFLVCTGGSPERIDEKLGLSQAALHVIRRTVSDEMAKDIVVHTLAPPISEEVKDPELSVVQKLVNTVAENIDNDANYELRRINLVGSLGALGIFMRDATTRDMILRITSPHKMLDLMLKSLEKLDHTMSLAVLRLLCEWTSDSSSVVEAMLSSSNSTSLSVLFASSGEKATMIGLLLGTAMKFMKDDRVENFGGWTRTSIVNMISNREGGVSGFVEDLEEFRQSELPWVACRLERQFFLDWYNAQVLLVRGRIVRELTGGSSIDAKEGGQSSSDLQSLLLKQSQELDEVRGALERTTDELNSCDKQLKIFKRRVESTPTQLDDMLTEFTSKNAQLELEVNTLRKELESCKSSHDMELSDRMKQIESLNSDITASLLREEESSYEIERLRTELAALSSTYSNLESEYNRTQSISSAAAREVPPAGEQACEADLSSHGRAGSEIEALRAENARLKQDARAADEWMRMAHARMGEIGAQNLQLRKEIESVKRTPEQEGEAVSSQKQLELSIQRCNDLEQELSAYKAERGREIVDSNIEKERDRINELEERLTAANREVAEKEGLLREVEELKGELELANANIIALDEERRQLEMRVTSQDNENRAEGELVQRLRASLQSKEEELDSLRVSVKSLQDELASSSAALEETIKEKERPSETTGDGNVDQTSNSFVQDQVSATVEPLQSHQAELSELRAAYSTAQEWMGKAVEHHNILSGQIASLTSENEHLKTELQQVSQRDNQTENGNVEGDQLKELQELLLSKDAEISRLTSAATSIAKEHQDEVAVLQGNIELITQEICDLKESIQEKVAEGRRFSNDLNSLRITNAELEKTVDNYKTQVQSIEEELSSMRQEKEKNESEARGMIQKLGEFEQWSHLAQESLDRLGTEKKQLEDEVERLKAVGSLECKNDLKALEELQEIHNQLKVDHGTLNDRVQTLMLELDNKSSLVAVLENSLAERSSMIEAAEKELGRAKVEQTEREQESISVIRQWQERVEQLEKIISQLHEAVSKQQEDASEVVSQWMKRCSELEVKVGLSESEDSEFREKIGELEETIKYLEESLETTQNESTGAIEKWSARCDELENFLNESRAQVERLELEKYGLQASLHEATETAEKEKEVHESLSLQIQVLENQLDDLRKIAAEKEAQNLAQKIESQAKAIKERDERLGELQKDVEDLLTKFDGAVRSFEGSKDRVRMLEDALGASETKLQAKEYETNATILKWEEHYHNLEEQASELSAQLALIATEKERLEELLEAKEEEAQSVVRENVQGVAEQMELVVNQSEQTIKEWQDRVSELETLVAELEVQLDQQQNEAVTAIAQWEATCSTLEEHLTEMRSSNVGESNTVLEALSSQMALQLKWIRILARDDVDEEHSSFDFCEQTSLEDALLVLRERSLQHDSKIVQLIDKLQKEIAYIEAEVMTLTEVREKTISEIAILTERNEGMLLELVTLKSQLEAQGKDIESSTEQNLKQKSITENLRSKLGATEEALKAEAALRQEFEGRIRSLQEEHSSLQDSLEQAKVDLESKIALQSALREELAQAKSLNKELQTKLSGDKEYLAHENHALHVEVMRLEEELAAANEFLQIKVTDEVSQRATEMATNALRREIETLRCQMDSNQNVLLEERRARVTAERELSLLSANLAGALKICPDSENADETIKKVVAQASDSLGENERHELVSIRKALANTMEEARSLRVAEEKASSRAAGAETQLTICEQEVVAARADVAFLTSILQEKRDAEAARIASFEYRISAFEDERDVVRRVHMEEIEALRSELSHLSMEKDRLLYSLKDSEKTNAALVYASSKELAEEVGGDTAVELARLRVSNAHLLSAATEEASRAERRILEAVTASASVVEADIIVERELRLAAETALENMKAQVDDHQASRDSNVMPDTSPKRVQNQLSQARDKARKLEGENSTLRSEIDKLKAESAQKISLMTEECRKAQALVLKLENELKMGAEVAAEAEKIQTANKRATSTSDEKWFVITHNQSDGHDTPSRAGDLVSVEAYDLIIEQKKAIQEEREMYQQLLAEHDDLLALLAQQDLEMASLNDALAKAAGQSAVNAAVQQAQEKAILQFGKYVRLS